MQLLEEVPDAAISIAPAYGAILAEVGDGYGAIRTRVAKHLDAVGKHAHLNGPTRVVSLVIYGVGECLLQSGVRIVVEPHCFSSVGHLHYYLLDDTVLEVAERLSQLMVQRSGKGVLEYSVAPFSVRQLDNIYVSLVGEEFLGLHRKEQKADVLRLGVLGRAVDYAHVSAELYEVHRVYAFIERAAHLAQVRLDEGCSQVAYFRGKADPVVERNLAGKIVEIQLLLMRGLNRR